MVKCSLKKTRKQRAGKFIRKGSYGCGYYPALKCEGENVREPGLFSKLMRKSDAIEEFRQHDLLFPIDPDQSYLLYPLKMCKPNLKSFNSGDPNNNTKNCDELFERNNDKMILMYNNGGPDLNKINLKAEDYAPFFRDLLQLFEGLKLMHDNDIAHLDIKEENTVHERISSNPIAYRFRYIDFGLSRKTRFRTMDTVYSAYYFSFPYELRFIHPSFEEEDITTASVIEFIKNSYDLAKFNFFYPSSFILPQYSSNPEAIKYAKKCFEEIFDQYKNSEILVSDIQKGTDIFALGRLLSYIYGSLIGHKWLRNNIEAMIYLPKVQIKNIDDVVYSRFTAINTMEEGPIKEWNEQVANKISFPIYQLIKSMIHLQLDHRYNIDEALEEYKKLIPAMEELFSKENIEKYHSHIFTYLASPNQKNTTRKGKLQRQKGFRIPSYLRGNITNSSNASKMNTSSNASNMNTSSNASNMNSSNPSNMNNNSSPSNINNLIE